MIRRQFRSLYCFSLFNKKRQNNEKTVNSYSGKQGNILFKKEDYQNLTTTNNYFQGIRLNTEYEKTFNKDSRDKANLSIGRKLADLPFKGAKKYVNQNQTPSMTQLGKSLFDKMDKAKLDKKLKQICKGFFSDLVHKTVTIKIEPNFQRECRQVFSSITKNDHIISIKEVQNFKIAVTKIDIFHGIEVTRNNNYSTDSYLISEEDGYMQFRLYKKKDEKLPQKQFFAQRNTVMRLYVETEAPWKISIEHKQKQVYNSQNLTYQFIVEMNMRKPPQFSYFSLSPLEYLKAYRPALSDLIVTNVDYKNQYASLTFEPNIKRESLINVLE